MLLVTEKRERDVLGQIVVPLSNVDDSCPTEPLRVPLQPGLRCPDLHSSPGELIYSVWITTRDLSAASEDRSLTSRTTASLGRLRRKLNNSPIISSASRWNDFKTNRRHSVDALLVLHSGVNPDLAHISFEDDSCPTTAGEDLVPIPSPDGYIKRSSLPTVSEYYFPRPQILEVCPCQGPTSGGTVVTVRGRNLGLSRDDVVGLFICGSDVVDSVRYISSERLVCTTVAWRPCVGSITVETASGGRASSAAQFTFTAGSEPPVSRVSALQISSEMPSTRSRWRTFSLSALENIETPKKTVIKDLLQRQKSHEAASSAETTARSERRRSSLADIQSVNLSRDVTRQPRKLPQIENILSRRINDDKVDFYYFRSLLCCVRRCKYIELSL